MIRTTDAGLHWERKSRGLWDTAVSAVWVHPDDPTGAHVFAGTHSGVYESVDAAETWARCEETKGWGNVRSFRQGVIGGVDYILAGTDGGILTRPLGGSGLCGSGQPCWQKIDAPGGQSPSAELSVVTTGGVTEVVTCMGPWTGGQLWYAKIDSATNATWDGPKALPNHTYTNWSFYPGQSAVWAKCSSPTKCQPTIHPLGKFDTLKACQAAVNSTKLNFSVASYTYMHADYDAGIYNGSCFAIDDFTWSDDLLHGDPKADSGRAPGKFAGGPMVCSNAAVDPHDRDHLIFAHSGDWRVWESKDGAATAKSVPNATHAAFYVMIDQGGWWYTATQAGAFVSKDGGTTWDDLHVIVHRRVTKRLPSGGLMDRVPHDYQRIMGEFRGDGVAFPSDQGLHIFNRSSPNLTTAVGDMHNAMSLSAIIAPSDDGTSRNLIVNMWDWDVSASWDDGATWSGWIDGEANPGSCGEGGGGIGMGASGKLAMFHHNHWYSSLDRGHNWKRGDTPAPAGGFDYERDEWSRTEPSGRCYALLSAPPNSTASDKRRAAAADDDDDDDDDDDEVHRYREDWTGEDDEDADDEEDEAEEAEEARAHALARSVPGLLRPARRHGAANGNIVYLMVSDDFGQNWTWTPMPPALQAGAVAVDPTTKGSVFALTESCLAHSADGGRTWGNCSTAAGLVGKFSQLVVKDATTMWMARKGDTPLRTTDGGATWAALPSTKTLFEYGATLTLSLSWSGDTLVLHGNDRSAIGRGEYGSHVWKSSDGGESWSDETGDLVTISMGAGVWYERDFYLVTAGEGVMVKREFDGEGVRAS